MTMELKTLAYKLYTTNEQLTALAELAQKIWTECYSNIYPADQIEYMLQKYQSFEVLRSQVDSGTLYFVVEIDDLPVGYYAFEIRNDDKLYGKEYLFISKIYLMSDIRHKGIASLMLKQIRKYARKNGLELIKLYVNRKNAHAISVFRHVGMIVINDIDRDLGDGYIAEDHIMGKMV